MQHWPDGCSIMRMCLEKTGALKMNSCRMLLHFFGHVHFICSRWSVDVHVSFASLAHAIWRLDWICMSDCILCMQFGASIWFACLICILCMRFGASIGFAFRMCMSAGLDFLRFPRYSVAWFVRTLEPLQQWKLLPSHCQPTVTPTDSPPFVDQSHAKVIQEQIL